MMTMERSQIRVLVDSAKDTDEFHNEQLLGGEQTTLLRTTHRSYRIKVKSRSWCVKSKAALLVLCWNAFVTMSVGYVLESGSVLATAVGYSKVHTNELQTFAPAFFGILALLYLFYPLAGYLADIKCGRYKTITNCLWFFICGGTFTTVGAIIISCYLYQKISLQVVSTTLFAIGFGFSTFFGLILIGVSYVSFSANVIQFGIDQLHDSPSEDCVLFIHWFLFISHLSVAINKFAVVVISYIYKRYIIRYKDYYVLEYIAGIYAIPIIALTCLAISAWIARCKHQWFMIDTGSRNPYKLVYKVIKFAAQHKIPIRRSAFTYCEDELPSRMDLGKEKYGGPFTTEQVEDVKAFLGILQVLLALGPVFATDIAAGYMLYKFSNHLHNSWYNQYRSILQTRPFTVILMKYFEIGGQTEILIVILLPIYLCLLQAFIHRYIPGMLRRIGLGMIIRLLSLFSIFLIDTIGHTYSTNNWCFMHLHGYNFESLSISMWYVVIPYTLNAISELLFYIAAYEFVCAQSPHAMKGLLIGTFFTIKGMFQLISELIILIPFTIWKSKPSFPSCGFVYYLVNILVALIGLVAYTWIARRYQYRQRDEPDNIYRYAEEYYDRAHNEHLQNTSNNYCSD